MGQGYWDGDGQYQDVLPVPGISLTDATAAVNGSTVEVGDRAVVRVRSEVTAISGGGTFIAKVETRREASDSWREAFAATGQTAGGTEFDQGAVDRFVRVVADVPSGSTVTAEVTGEASG